jgi:hypothetical protein
MNIMKEIVRKIIVIFCLISIGLSLRYPTSLNLSTSRVEGAINLSQFPVDYLIITVDVFVDDVKPLAIWKLQRGLIPTIVTVENISSTYEGNDLAESIRECIRYFHEEKNTQWVVLAGGPSFVPTRAVKISMKESVSCDHYYVNLDNNWELNSDGSVSIIDYFDWDAEVYVGRLPADNNTQLKELINCLINYERNPPVGPWMTNALFGGAFARFNSDANGNNIFDEEDSSEFDANRNHNWLKTNVFPSNWTSILLGETEGVKITDYPVDRPLNELNVIEEINNGASTGMFDSHGSPTSMARMTFTYDEDNDSLYDYGVDDFSSDPLISVTSALTTEGKRGFYFLCACATGTFILPYDCLSEYILRSVGIGCIASSGSAYYDSGWYAGEHGGWFTQGLSSRFWEQFFKEGGNHPGKAFIQAKKDYVKDFLELNGKEESTNKTLIQYNLMGDPEVPVWTKIPSELEYTVSNNSHFAVLNTVSSDHSIGHVTVTLLNSTYYWRGITNNEGLATLPVSSNELTNLSLTISKINYLPLQNSVENIPVNIPNFSQEHETETTTSSLNNSTPFPEFWLFIIAIYFLTRKKICQV